MQSLLNAFIMVSASILLAASPLKANTLSEADLQNLIKRSTQYVALFNTLNNFVIDKKNPLATGGWNKTEYPKGLANASVRALPRPNNDTLYVISMLDLRNDAVVIEYPAFQSKFVSLEVSALDHYVDIPLATSAGDFKKPATILFYSARTDGYSGEPVQGVDQIIEMSGDYGISFLRVMPQANDPKKFKSNMAQIQKVTLKTLAEFQGHKAKPVDPYDIPQYSNDATTFATNYLEVMQWVFNHTTFDPDKYEMDKQALAALSRVGVKPGKNFAASVPPSVDYKRLAAEAAKMFATELKIWNTPKEAAPFLTKLFLPKGQMTIDAMFLQSVVGPLGQPASQAMYPGITTTDGKPMNALNDYVIKMTKDQLPPAIAFWSATLYDTKHGYFIPNKENKYSVGENAGMQLDADGGIAIYIAAEQPEGVPAENWLPIKREDLGIDLIMRIYQPDLEKMKTWKAPKAEIVK
ncbi:Uncharacterized conserved protein [Pseudovibrio denitrificans]|uniref:Uncharacterized conserved protein n=1 Tax=Pseudovibrio denitrificans TaxID=258256 RepID=A0A1I7DYT1_9HYPH|nr:DUF1214 domain-containing protein [Pseudovibrio denitrificans]SFU16776.1 Uncharacterized conserved protein [Pseudovibrio denitrificans]